MTATPDHQPAAWSPSAALEWQERQLKLWEALMRFRLIGIAALVVLALLPSEQTYHDRVALLLVVVVLPYNVLFAVLLHRQRKLSPVLAYADQAAAVLLFAFVPELLTPVVLVLVAVNAASVLAFGRRTGAQAAAVGAVGVVGLALVHQPPEGSLIVAVYLVTSFFVVAVVGSVADVERDLRRRYTELMGGIDAVVWEQLTRRPSTLYVNRRAEELLGYPATDWQQPGFWRNHVHPDDVEEARRAYRDAIRRGENLDLSYRMLASDGRVLHMRDRMRVETDANGRPTHVRGVMMDITAEREAAAQADQYVNLVENIRNALFVFGLPDPGDDWSLEVLALNPEAASIAGVNPRTAIHRPFADVVDLPEMDLVVAALADVARTGRPFTFDDLRLEPATRGSRIYTANAFPLPGEAIGLSLQDVTERAMTAEVLRRQALHDGLTGLPNRTLLADRLREALGRSQRTNDPVALLVMDLDQFKEVNDALGHDHGDRLLIEMSRRLHDVLRDADTLARLGGDEFAVLLTVDADEAGAQAVARRIRLALDDPFEIGGITLQSNASIGIAVFPDHAQDAETLAQRADVAMYTAKRSGTGIATYAPEHDQSSVRRLALIGELRQAIQASELELHFQPTIDLRTGRVTATEALVRWRHPEHGLLPPAEFIELAEVSGTIQALTRWVLDEALVQLGIWTRNGIDVAMSVNLSVRNLYDRELVPWLAGRLASQRIDPARLKLEITESELMDDPMLALEVLGKLKSMGAATSVDDFGTGYSSLSYLKNLPIDELKIDRSFVNNMVVDDNDLTIVRSTIDLAHNLGLDVVAEGVEDLPTVQRLAELGCDRAQGYVLSRPVPAIQLTRWLTDGGPDEVAAALRGALATPLGAPSGATGSSPAPRRRPSASWSD